MKVRARTLRRPIPAGIRHAFWVRCALALVLAAAGAPASFAQQRADDPGANEAGIDSTEAGIESNVQGIDDADAQAFPIASWSRTDALAEDAGTQAARGRAVFNNWCGACHSRDMRNAPGTRSLEFKYRGELPAAIEDRTDLTAELVAFYVRNGVATMPFYRPTEISDTDLEALAVYLAD